MGALIASKVAGSSYLPTAVEAVKASVAGFVLPFLIVFIPALLLLPGTALLPLVAKIGGSMIVLLSIQASLSNYYLSSLKFYQRALLALCAAAILVYVTMQSLVFLFGGLAIFIAVSLQQLSKKGAQSPA